MSLVRSPQAQATTMAGLGRPVSMGFTLVELIMALAFFSFMMAILSVGIIQIGRIYQANLSSKRTQTAARNAMEDITREIRNSTNATASGSTLCLSGNRFVQYTLVSDQLVKNSGGSSCGMGTGTTLVGNSGPGDPNNNLKARQFQVTKLVEGTKDAGVQVVITVTTGADDLVDTSGGAVACKPGVSGSQYCSATQFDTTVSLQGGSL